MTTPLEISIFDFQSASDYLSAVYRHRKQHAENFSLRLWAQALGMKESDSGNLSRILSGQRDLSRQMIDRFFTNLTLGPEERAYFELLALGRDKISPQSLSSIRDGLRWCAGRAADAGKETDAIDPDGLSGW